MKTIILILVYCVMSMCIILSILALAFTPFLIIAHYENYIYSLLFFVSVPVAVYLYVLAEGKIISKFFNL